ncbi:MAG: LysR family transcriptional regulator [Dermatophilaceae bacterium]
MPSKDGTPPDLNLVRTFVMIYETQSVTGAAARLHVTQPTVSYALGKMRRRFRDELFYRSTDGFVPTATATRLYEPLRRALNQIDDAVLSAEAFDPRGATDQFVIALTDLGEMAFLPTILRNARAAAPTVSIVSEPLVVGRSADALVEGRIDLAVSHVELGGGRLRRHPILLIDHVVISAVDHPRLAGRQLTQRRFAAERHIQVVDTGNQAELGALVRGSHLDREVALQVSSYNSLPYLVQGSELLGLIPRPVARILARHHPIAIHEVPWPLPPIEVSLYGRHSHERWSGVRWFASLVRESVDEVAARAAR